MAILPGVATLSQLIQPQRSVQFQIRFASLHREGRALALPCDAGGHVALDQLSDRGRTNYFVARAMVGRDFALPSVCLA